MKSPLFKSFFQGGFECSSHRRKDGKRLDVIAATHHDVYAQGDYQLLADLGLRTVRDGVRWHLIETTPGHYDWSSLLPMVRAASSTNTQVIWDIFHYGWPDNIDIWSPAFVDRYAAFAGALAQVIKNETDEIPFYVPVNEMSFMAWAGGQFAVFNPGGLGRGDELKDQLVSAAIAGIEAVWNVEPRARIALVEPAINVLPDLNAPESAAVARAYNNAQFDAWDMISGLLRPELGGSPKYLDIIGINYYCHNQWTVNGGPIEVTNSRARKFSGMLQENYTRYQRPIFISETGIEGDLRPGWFRYVCEEVKTAMDQGIPVEGICLYPVMNHPGWDDDRHCPNGLIDYSTENFERSIVKNLSEELVRQQILIKR